jgi:hypothetical protein
MTLRALCLGIILVVSGFAASGDALAQSNTITCESVDGHERVCPADTRGGVILTAQLSKASCRQGHTWGYDDRGIWTSNGCRARFTVGSSSYDSWDSGRERASQSSNNNAAAAAAAVALLAVGAAAVHQEHKDDRRDREREQGYRGGGSYDYRPQNDYRYPSDYGRRDTQTVTCESNDGRQRFCPADVGRARVELTRQLSRGECRFARNWGYDRRGVWVSDGCRGTFTVYY